MILLEKFVAPESSMRKMIVHKLIRSSYFKLMITKIQAAATQQMYLTVS
jgi:hypothetical protein